MCSIGTIVWLVRMEREGCGKRSGRGLIVRETETRESRLSVAGTREYCVDSLKQPEVPATAPDGRDRSHLQASTRDTRSVRSLHTSLHCARGPMPSKATTLLLLYAPFLAAMAFYPVSQNKPKTPVKNSLKKKSGALTVSIEVLPSDDVEAPIDDGEIVGEGRRTVALTAEERVERLSGALRGGREGSLASAIFTSSVDALSTIAKEQATAKGDFPGPCPVVFNGEATEASQAIAAGAQGVVLPAREIEVGKSIVENGIEVLWQVSSAEEIAAIVADEAAPEDAFLLSADDANEAEALVAALPTGALGVAAVDAMQDEDGEIARGRELASAGCKAVLVKGACVGDAEDLPYATFAIKQLTSKRSSSFAIDGHTGSTNGHFGTMSKAGASPDGGWARVSVK